MTDGLNMLDRPGEPESALLQGMAAPAPRDGASLFGASPTSMPDTSGPPYQALQEPPSWQYDFDPGNGMARATFNGEVSFLAGGSATAGVTSFNTRTGAVTLSTADITGAGGAPSFNPTFTGSANAQTPPPGDNSTQIATTMFVQQALGAQSLVSSFNGRAGAIVLSSSDVTSAGGAPSASPALTGNPTAPTPVATDASSSIATTQFVSNAIAGSSVTSWNGRKGAVSLQLSDVTSVGGAPIASPVFTGVPAGTTAAPGTATTQLATTAFVTNAITAGVSGVSSFNTRTGAVVLNTADITNAGGAPLNSPALTGTPTAPTIGAGDATTKLATTQFVANAIAGQTIVNTFNGRSGAVTLQLADVTSVGGAPQASPTFTGAPKAPTPTAGDNSTNLATTAFVAASFAPATGGSYVSKSGDTMTGGLTVAPAAGVSQITQQATGSANTNLIMIKGQSGQQSNISAYTGSNVAANLRWQLTMSNVTAESGAATGSDFSLSALDNNGAFLSNPLTITRANGNATFGGNVVSIVPASGGATLNINGATTAALSIAPANGIAQIQMAATTGNNNNFILTRPTGASANLIIGRTAASNRWMMSFGDATAETGSPSGTGSNWSLYGYKDDGSTLVSICSASRVTGVMSFTNAIVNGSDARLKENIEPIADALDKVKQLRGVSFNKIGQDPRNRNIGFIAQEVAPISPESVQASASMTINDALGTKGKEGETPMLALDYGGLTALLAEAVKTLAAQNAELEIRVGSLEAAMSGGQA